MQAGRGRARSSAAGLRGKRLGFLSSPRPAVASAWRAAYEGGIQTTTGATVYKSVTTRRRRGFGTMKTAPCRTTRTTRTMRSFNPIRLYRNLVHRRAPQPPARSSLPTGLRPIPEPTVYADAPLTRLLLAIDRRASDVELALAEYARARRAAGVRPETMLVEFKRVLRRALRGDVTRPRLTGRLIELYFAG